MNIAGLNKLGLAPQASKSQGKTASKDKESFGEVLGQVQPRKDEKPHPQAQNQSDSGAKEVASPEPREKVAPKTFEHKTGVENKNVVNFVKSDDRTKATALDPDSIPNAPTTPPLESPILGDKFATAPTELNVVNPLNKPQVAVAGKGEDVEVDSLTRRAVWSDFLRKMKNELGVSAEDVMGAFDSLSAEDLAKPPTETVDKVVMALGLSPQQTQMAKQFFMELIQRTQPKSMGAELANSEKQISLTLMSQRELDRKNQNKAVDNLNQNFFMQGAYERPVQQAQVATSTNEMQADPQAVQQPNNELPLVLSDDPATRATQLQAAAQQSGKFAVPKEMQNGRAPKADMDSILKKFTEGQGKSASTQTASTAEEQTLAAGKESFAAQAQAITSSQAAPLMAQATQMAPVAADTASADISKANEAALAAMNAIFKKSVTSDASQAQADSGDEQDFTSDATYLNALAGPQAQAKVNNPQATEFQQQLNSANSTQPMAVPDLVKNASVMVHDGGGEMKVTLTPDGLGEVAMRVSVKDGKVNVQMITESDEAKRLIERSLGELKTQLTHNHLQVSDIKIDTATNLGKQLEQQYQDAQRQATQQNWEQFRQDNQGWRRSFFEVPGAKAYRGQSEAPRDMQAPTSVASKQRAGGSRRLNLVA